MFAAMFQEATGELAEDEGDKRKSDAGGAGGKRKAAEGGAQGRPRARKTPRAHPDSIPEPASAPPPPPPYAPTQQGVLKGIADILKRMAKMEQNEAVEDMGALMTCAYRSTQRKASAKAARLVKMMRNKARDLGLQPGLMYHAYQDLHTCVSHLFKSVVEWNRRRPNDDAKKLPDEASESGGGGSAAAAAPAPAAAPAKPKNRGYGIMEV